VLVWGGLSALIAGAFAATGNYAAAAPVGWVQLCMLVACGVTAVNLYRCRGAGGIRAP